MVTGGYAALHADIQELGKQIASLETLVAAEGKQIARLETLMSTESQRCPYREQIAVIATTAVKQQDLEKTVTQVRLDAIKSGAGGGGIVALAGGVLFAIGKMASWW